MTTQFLIRSVEAALTHADETTEPLLLPEVKGMTGWKVQHFLNRMCQELTPDCRYLEVGVHRGATFFAALYRNSIRATGYENWSQFDEDKTARADFERSLELYDPDNTVLFFERDFFAEPLKHVETYNVYFYDGEHAEGPQSKALAHALPAMESSFIFIVDDWTWPLVKTWTMESLDALHITPKASWERKQTCEGFDPQGWWNGLAVFVIEK